VGFVSCVGDDQFGEIARAWLAAAGVDTRNIPVLRGRSTGLTVIMQRGTWRNMLTYPGTIAEVRVGDIDFDYLGSARHFHLSSFYLQRGLQPDVPDLFKKLKSRGLTISLDCNDDPDDVWNGGIGKALRHVDILLPNAREAMRLTGVQDVQIAAEKLAAIVPLVVIKLGADGAMARRGNEQWSSPGLKVDVVDPVGAGDSFDAGFLHEYLKGSDIQNCLRMGNIAGALSVTRPGGTDAFRDAKHREDFFRRHIPELSSVIRSR
jgi:sugar/nucleoside kinase (ribokinase family)